MSVARRGFLRYFVKEENTHKEIIEQSAKCGMFTIGVQIATRWTIRRL